MPDQRGGDFDRVVLGAGEEIDGAPDRRLQTVAEIGDLRNRTGRPSRSLAHLFSTRSSTKATVTRLRGPRRRDAAAGIDRQLAQRLQAAEAVALRLVEN